MAAVGNFLSCTITKLELLVGSSVIGSATGFFLKVENNWYLATNWHVFSGRDNITGQPRHKEGAIPDKCRFYTAIMASERLEWHANDVDLGDALTGNANWYEHPNFGQSVDIAAILLKDFAVKTVKDLLDPTGHSPDMFIDLGAEVFLPGFPLGLSAAGYMALWKKGSVASSLEFGEGINRYFYVDTATREGMSGSPCLAISNWRHYEMDRKTGKVKVVERPLSHRLLGIYSGRKNPSDQFEAQIGIVLRENLIFETIASKKTATIKLTA